MLRFDWGPVKNDGDPRASLGTLLRTSSHLTAHAPYLWNGWSYRNFKFDVQIDLGKRDLVSVQVPGYKYKYKYKWGFVERGLQIVQGR